MGQLKWFTALYWAHGIIYFIAAEFAILSLVLIIHHIRHRHDTDAQSTRLKKRIALALLAIPLCLVIGYGVREASFKVLTWEFSESSDTTPNSYLFSCERAQESADQLSLKLPANTPLKECVNDNSISSNIRMVLSETQVQTIIKESRLEPWIAEDLYDYQSTQAYKRITEHYGGDVLETGDYDKERKIYSASRVEKEQSYAALLAIPVDGKYVVYLHAQRPIRHGPIWD